MSIKTILISQPEPTNENSPYSSLIRKYKLKIDFRKFIHVEGLTAKEVRAQKVDFSKIDIKEVMYFILYLCGFKLAPWLWLYSIY